MNGNEHSLWDLHIKIGVDACILLAKAASGGDPCILFFFLAVKAPFSVRVVSFPLEPGYPKYSGQLQFILIVPLKCGMQIASV